MKANLFKSFLVLMFLLSLTAIGTAQKLVNGGKPQSAAVDGFIRAECINAAKNTRVCKGMKANENGDGVFIVQQNHKTLGMIDAAVNSQSQPQNFYVLYGDLDNNKAAELIVVDFNGQSMGMGVSFYNINIFPDFETKNFQKPLRFSTYEFGADGTFVYDAAKRETLILATEWQDYEVIDPRGGGLYFIGRFFRYQNGTLKPAAGKHVLTRRYLSSFQNERGKTLSSPRIPYLWLNSPSAKKLSVDPEFMINPDSSQTGVIEKFERIKEKAAAEGGEMREVEIEQITVRFDSGKTETIIFTKSEGIASLVSNKGKIFPERFGVLPQKLAFPNDFEPTIVFDKFEGKRVRLDAFKPEHAKAENPAEQIYKLWFIEN